MGKKELGVCLGLPTSGSECVHAYMDHVLHILEKIKAFSLNFVFFVCMLFILKMAHFVKMLLPLLPWKLTQPLVAPN